MNKKIVIYTAISGPKHYLKTQRFVSDNCNFVCFYNNITSVKPWEIRHMPQISPDKRLNYKYYKMMPHLLFPDYEYSLWIDSLFVIDSDIRKYFDEYLKDANISLFKHHAGRNCLYEEGEVCTKLGLAKKGEVDKQLEKYREEGYPSNNGLVMSGIIFRRHHERDVIESMEDWFEEVREGCKRDQVSFNYVAWKNKLKFNLVKEMHHNNHPCFKIN